MHASPSTCAGQKCVPVKDSEVGMQRNRKQNSCGNIEPKTYKIVTIDLLYYVYIFWQSEGFPGCLQ